MLHLQGKYGALLIKTVRQKNFHLFTQSIIAIMHPNMKPDQHSKIHQNQREWDRALHGATAFLKSPWITVILLPFVIPIFSRFSDTFMSHLSTKSVIFSTATAATVVIWIIAAFMVRGIKNAPPPKNDPFRVSSANATLILGSGPKASTFGFAKDGKAKFTLLGGNAPSPLNAKFENGSILLDMNLRAGDGKSPIRFKDNKLIDPPARWDSNFNERAFEVVDESGMPVLQVIHKSESELILMGEFLFPSGGIIADSKGCQMTFGTLPDRRASITPIFKYPAWKYPGQLTE